jgi:cell division protein FtsB
MTRPFKDLLSVARAGREGLEAVFTVGSLWEYCEANRASPERDAQPDVFRVVQRPPSPVYISGTNYFGQPRWLVYCQSLETGAIEGLPPTRLSPHIEVPTVGLSQKNAALADEVARLTRRVAELEKNRDLWRDLAKERGDKIVAAREALRGALA